MIKSIDLATVIVRDQEEAIQFYTEKLGFEKKHDAQFGPNARWVTVAPPGSNGTQFILWDPRHWMSPEAAEGMLALIGKMPGFVLGTDDCRATIADLEGKGVKVSRQPEDQPYGVEAVIEDTFGNSMVVVETRGQ